MSEEFYSLLILICDKCDIEDGLPETLTIKIEEGETRLGAKELAIDIGWRVDGDKTLCPKCNGKSKLSIVK